MHLKVNTPCLLHTLCFLIKCHCTLKYYVNHQRNISVYTNQKCFRLKKCVWSEDLHCHLEVVCSSWSWFFTFCISFISVRQLVTALNSSAILSTDINEIHYKTVYDDESCNIRPGLSVCGFKTFHRFNPFLQHSCTCPVEKIQCINMSPLLW